MRLREGDVVDVEAVHHVEVAVRRQPLGDRLVDHRLHVRRHHRQREAARRRTPATGRTRSGFPPGTCAAAAGRCRSRRFPWPGAFDRRENGRVQGRPWRHSTEGAAPSRSRKKPAVRMDPVTDATTAAASIAARRPAYAVRSTIDDVPDPRLPIAAARRPQPRAARRRHPAGRAGADPRRRRLRQDPRPDHPRRLADPDRPALAGRRAGRHLHQQGRQGDADPARRDAARSPCAACGSAPSTACATASCAPTGSSPALPQGFQILDSSDQLSAVKRRVKAMNLDEERHPPKQ